MSAPSKSTGKAPGQRAIMSRNKKSFRVDFQMQCYDTLLELRRIRTDGKPESCVEVLERLILQAKTTPKLPWEKNEFVRDRAETHRRMA